MFRTAICSVLAGLMVATAASPCGFHNYVPQPSLTDKLLGSNDIVLARSTPEDPFSFKTFTTLEGANSQIDIPFLVDTPTRRKFAIDESALVLFAREDNYGPWQRLAYVDASMAPVLATIMERLPQWEMGEYLDRFEYFASLVGHDDPRIHKLALLELDQADYKTLRELKLSIDPSRLAAQIDAPNETQFKAIRILLLGLSGVTEAGQYLETAVNRNVANEGQYLGAFTTAWIELVGPAAVEEITRRYLTDQNLSLLARESLIEAIALHGQNGNEAMDTTISVAVESALWMDPRLAGAVARQFGYQGNWSHYASLQSLKNDESVFLKSDQLDVQDYLKYAKQAGARP